MTDAQSIMLQVADHIEAHPECYSFGAVHTPIKKTCRACLLGWIGFFAGNIPADKSLAAYISLKDQAKLIGFGSDDRFYHEMYMIEDKFALRTTQSDWKNDPLVAAKCLRALAEGEER